MDSVIRFSANIAIDYPNIIQRGIIQKLGSILISQNLDVDSIVIISDHTVAALYGKMVIENLASIAVDDIPLLTFPDGELSKSTSTLEKLTGELLCNNVHRRSLIIALGGGVVCDTVGFIAANFMRGVSYVNIPTSLIAQVDAGIGGKVAVNYKTCKNLIGSFYHPRTVIVDPDLLKTLPVDEKRNGLAEIVKVAVIRSELLFTQLEECEEALVEDIGLKDKYDDIIRQAVQIKIDLLLTDPFEMDLRRALNFGHTFAHPLEVVKGYRMRHGYAVSIGMCIATMVAVRRRLIHASQAERIFALIGKLGLPRCVPHVDLDVLWDALRPIQQIRANSLAFVVPTAIGSMVFIDDLTYLEFVSSCKQLEDEYGHHA